MNEAVPPPRRLRPRFSLRTLLIGVTLLAALLAGFVHWRTAKQREAAAADKILDRGGNPGRISLEHRSPWVQWLAIALPKECFESVTYAYLPSDSTDDDLAVLDDLPNVADLHIEQCTRVTPTGMIHLRGLHNLEVLSLSNTQVGDAGLKHLSRLRGIREFWLEGSGAGDASVPWIASNRSITHLVLDDGDITDASLPLLASLEHLEVLALRRTKVTSEGMAILARMRRLQHLYLGSTPITDAGLIHLEELSNLRGLDVRLTQVTDAGRARFKLAQPKCRVK